MTVQPTRDQLRALANAATPGPWEADHSEENNYSIKSPGTEWGDGYAWVSDPSDAEFIAAARTAIPALLDELHEEARENHTLRERLAHATDDAEFWKSSCHQADADTRRAREGILEQTNALAAAEHRAARAEARIEAVEDVLDHWRLDDHNPDPTAAWWARTTQELLDALDQAEARIQAVRDVLDAAEDRGPIGLTFDGTPFPVFVSSDAIRRALDPRPTDE